MMSNSVNLGVNLGPLYLKNPIMPASGTFEVRNTLLNKKQLNYLGAIITKNIALKEREVNSGPRIWETYCGMLNAFGISSQWFEDFIKKGFQINDSSLGY